MRAILALLLMAAAHAHALTADEIRKIAAQPHSRENLIEPLRIYPDAREYEIELKMGPTMDALNASPPVVAQEKMVEGKFIVSMIDLPELLEGAKERRAMIMIVGYDDKTDTYKKWVLVDGGVHSSTGIADLDKRAISWTSDQAVGQGGMSIGHEVHADDSSRWKEVIIQGGKVVWIVHGAARKTK